MKILLFGATGWLGSQLKTMMETNGDQVISAQSRLEDYQGLIEEINRNSDCTHCLIASGMTGRPNVDQLETKKEETLRVNVIGTSIIADLCSKKGIHVTYLGTGCLYGYSDEHPIGGSGFKEGETPNFSGSFYSHSKILTENILKELSNVLILRIRMPISDDLHPRNFITKISKYEKVVDVPNSMTVLTDLLPIIPDMMAKQLVGIYNFTNPGVISHNQILDLYRQYIDPNFTYQNFSLEDQAKILKAGRSNNCLDVTKLLGHYPNIPEILESMEAVFQRMQQNLQPSLKVAEDH
jgi:dTDP-4-dehydrorhamnose reductase